MTKTAWTLVVVLSLLILPALPLAAAPLSGSLNISGSWRISQDAIDFFPPDGGPDGVFFVEPASSGDFAAIADTQGTAKDLDSSPAGQPVGSEFLLDSFLLFDAQPGWRFDLTFIQPGVFSSADCATVPAAGGQICTPAFPPPKSPFNLINASANSSSATFNVRGFAYNAANEKSIFVGTYTTQFENRSYQSLLNDIVAGIPVEKSYSASFTLTPIPEPGTLSIMLIGTGLLALGTLARRVRR